eukprot:jgi/Botrbrau1/14109/Bobra.182_3s0052.1
MKRRKGREGRTVLFFQKLKVCSRRKDSLLCLAFPCAWDFDFQGLVPGKMGLDFSAFGMEQLLLRKVQGLCILCELGMDAERVGKLMELGNEGINAESRAGMSLGGERDVEGKTVAAEYKLQDDKSKPGDTL